MSTANKTTSRSSRLGRRMFKVPPPLRFKTVKDARKHIEANEARVTEVVRTARGVRINVVYPDGKPRTLSIPKVKEEE